MPFVTWQHLSEAPHIAEIVLNREEVLNAFNTQMALELTKVCRELRDLSDIRVVGIRSSTPKAFCTGADLKERNRLSEVEWFEQHRVFEEMFRSLHDLPMPTIAVIDGYTLAGGFEIALNCDLWVVADSAVFALPEVTRGIMPGGGGTRLLAKRIGIHQAKEIVLTGRTVKAKEAAAMGLVNRLVSSDDLQATYLELAQLISDNAPLSVRYCKAAIEELFGMPDDEAYHREIEIYNMCISTQDRKEGVQAFVERRKPAFVGK